MSSSTTFLALMGVFIGGIISLVFYNAVKKKVNSFFYIALVCYGCAVISITLLPIGNYEMISLEYVPQLIHIIPFVSKAGVMSNLEIVQCAMNAIMFMPLGILVPLTFGKKLRIREFVMLCFMLSLTIEAIQLICTVLGIMFRIFDINDIIFNTLGGSMTYGFVSLIVRCLNKQERQAHSLSQKSNSI